MNYFNKKYCLFFALTLPFSANAEWYVGGEVIDTNIIPELESLTDEDPNSFIYQDSTSSSSLFGGYKQNKYFSVQVEYQDEISLGLDSMFAGSSLWFPEAEVSDFDSNALYLSGVSSYQINDNGALYFKGGLFNWEVDSNLFDIDTEKAAPTRGTDVFFGLGANYDLNARFEISAEWERFQMEEDDIDLLSTELKFKF